MLGLITEAKLKEIVVPIAIVLPENVKDTVKVLEDTYEHDTVAIFVTAAQIKLFGNVTWEGATIET